MRGERRGERLVSPKTLQIPPDLNVVSDSDARRESSHNTIGSIGFTWLSQANRDKGTEDVGTTRQATTIGGVL